MAGATANRHRDLELRFPITQSLKVDSEDVMPKDEYLKSSRSASTRHRNTWFDALNLRPLHRTFHRIISWPLTACLKHNGCMKSWLDRHKLDVCIWQHYEIRNQGLKHRMLRRCSWRSMVRGEDEGRSVSMKFQKKHELVTRTLLIDIWSPLSMSFGRWRRADRPEQAKLRHKNCSADILLKDTSPPVNLDDYAGGCLDHGRRWGRKAYINCICQVWGPYLRDTRSRSKPIQ